MNTNNQDFNAEATSQFDVKAFFFRYIRYWYLFVITIPLALAGAYIKTKYTKPVYSVNTTILINDESSSQNSSKEVLKELNLFDYSQKIKDEIEIIHSLRMVKLTAQALNIHTSYFKVKKTFDAETYEETPYYVEFDTAQKNKPLYINFHVKPLSSSEFLLVSEFSPKIDGKYHFGQMIKAGDFKFSVKAKPNLIGYFINRDLYFIIVKPLDIIPFIVNNLKVEQLNGDKDLSIIDISLNGENPNKIVDVLNTLTRVYIDYNLGKKNQKALNTIRFIDEQLIEITDSLHLTESKLTEFQSANKIINSDQSKNIFDQISTLESQKAQLLVQAKYLAYLKKYIVENKNYNDLLVPSTIGVADPLLNQLVGNLILLDAKRDEIQYSTKQKSSLLDKLNFQIETLKLSIIENVSNIIKSSDISLEEINKQMDKVDSEIKKLPKTQRELFKIERKFKLNDDVYTYLLEKRSEAAIAKASNVPDNTIIDEASLALIKKIAPKNQKNMMIGLIMGLIIPVVFLFLKGYLDDRIKEKKDVELITRHPIIGLITHSMSKSPLAVVEKPKSSIAESFRALRTNLHFLSSEKEKHIIVITSAHTGEGKTFSTLNLGCILAMSGKRTLLMGFDLRKPRLYQDFGLNNNIGISTYLIGKCSLTEAIQKTQLPELDIMPGGPVPPNPSELIALPRTSQMLEELQLTYDYIIIDTSPVGIVADGYLLMKKADINIFVVRHNQTTKKMIKSVFDEIEMNKISNLSLCINDITSQDSTGYRYYYGYGYNYSYYKSYGYYDEETVILPWYQRLWQDIQSSLKD